MIIRYSDGSYAHGVICSVTGGTLGAAVAGVDDAVEFRLIRGAWTSGRGLVVTFEFPIETEMAFLQIMAAAKSDEQQGHCAAGGECLLRRIPAPGGYEPAN
jgi:hypothetical protein